MVDRDRLHDYGRGPAFDHLQRPKGLRVVDPVERRKGRLVRRAQLRDTLSKDHREHRAVSHRLHLARRVPASRIRRSLDNAAHADPRHLHEWKFPGEPGLPPEHELREFVLRPGIPVHRLRRNLLWSVERRDLVPRSEDHQRQLRPGHRVWIRVVGRRGQDDQRRDLLGGNQRHG